MTNNNKKLNSRYSKTLNSNDLPKLKENYLSLIKPVIIDNDGEFQSNIKMEINKILRKKQNKSIDISCNLKTKIKKDVNLDNNKIKYDHVYKDILLIDNNYITEKLLTNIRDKIENKSKIEDPEYKRIKESNLFKYQVTQKIKQKKEKHDSLVYFVKKKDPIQQINKGNFTNLIFDYDFLNIISKENRASCQRLKYI